MSLHAGTPGVTCIRREMCDILRRMITGSGKKKKKNRDEEIVQNEPKIQSSFLYFPFLLFSLFPLL